MPGAGYLFPVTPEEREKALIPTDADKVRAWLLRSTETLAIMLAMPYGMDKKAELGKAVLECSQAYLLLDDKVDENGVPVGAGAEAQGEAQVKAAEAQANGQIAVNEHQHALNMELETHKASLQPTDPESFKRAPATGGHREPPRVQPNATEKKIEEKNKPKAEVLKGARGDRPLPRPRIGQ